MKEKPILATICLVITAGCATTSNWVGVREISGPADAIQGRDLSGFPSANVAHMAGGTAVTVDGELGEWESADWMVLDEEKQYEGENWGGPEDVSGRLALGYDEDMLYIAAEVTDGTVVWNRTGSDIWQADSIQVALDPWLSRNSGGYTADVTEFGISGGEDGESVQVWRWACPRPLESGPMEAEAALSRPGQDGVVYELGIPLAELGTWRPSLSGMCGGSWLINDNDGADREGFIQWTPGIGGSKNPSEFGVFRFGQPPGDVQLPAMMTRFHWERTVAAAGRPLEIQMQVLSQGRDRVAHVRATLNPQEGGKGTMVSFPAKPGRTNYAISFDTQKIPPGKHELHVEMFDGRGYTADTARPIYIYEPPKYRY